jgi:hypothetical protein
MNECKNCAILKSALEKETLRANINFETMINLLKQLDFLNGLCIDLQKQVDEISQDFLKYKRRNPE